MSYWALQCSPAHLLAQRQVLCSSRNPPPPNAESPVLVSPRMIPVSGEPLSVPPPILPELFSRGAGPGLWSPTAWASIHFLTITNRESYCPPCLRFLLWKSQQRPLLGSCAGHCAGPEGQHLGCTWKLTSFRKPSRPWPGVLLAEPPAQPGLEVGPALIPGFHGLLDSDTRALHPRLQPRGRDVSGHQAARLWAISQSRWDVGPRTPGHGPPGGRRDSRQGEICRDHRGFCPNADAHPHLPPRLGTGRGEGLACVSHQPSTARSL